MLQKIETNDAPKSPLYSQGVLLPANQPLIFVSGMLPIDPIINKMVEGDIKLLTRQVIMNIEAVLRASHCTLHHVVRTEVFLKDLKQDFAGMNEEYALWFNGQVPPARQTIQVAELPLGARVEISCIACVSN